MQLGTGKFYLISSDLRTLKQNPSNACPFSETFIRVFIEISDQMIFFIALMRSASSAHDGNSQESKRGERQP